MDRQRAKNSGLLVLTALIWGVAFVAQSVGMDYVGPFTFNAVRSLIGGLALLPCILWQDRRRKNKRQAEEAAAGQAKGGGAAVKEDTGIRRKNLWRGGILCGLALCAASSLQQYGILFTTVGKAGFITAMYIVLVPVFGLFLGRKVRSLIVLCVVMAAAGLYFLCMTEHLSLGFGDLLVLICAAVFTLHILVIDHFSPLVDGVRMSAIQFLTAGIACGVPMLIWETPNLSDIAAAWMPILYAGVMSCGVAYTLQILGQKNAEPTVASLLLSLESVFSVLAGWVLLGQRLSGRELFGCALMFAAIILAQLPEKKRGDGQPT